MSAQETGSGTTSSDFKTRTAGVFSRSAAEFDQVGPAAFSAVGRRLAEYADLRPGMQVLDVACGRGASLFPAAATVGPSGHVTGVDIAPGMISALRDGIGARGVDNATALVMDAERLMFDSASFDRVLCSLGLFFLPDLHAALSGMRRVLRPGGVLVASTFAGRDDELARRWRALLVDFEPRLAPAAPDPGHPLDSAAAVSAALQEAGFAQVTVTRQELTLKFADGESWWRWMWSHGSRDLLERLQGDDVAVFKERVTALALGDPEAAAPSEHWSILLSKGSKV